MKSKRGKCVKKNKQTLNAEPEELLRAPRSFIINRGITEVYVRELTKDFRRVMEPFTASSLKARKNDSIKDYVALSGILHVSHLCVFSKTENSLFFKIAKLPRGPTLSFKVHSYSLARDVISSLKKQMVVEEAFKHSPLVVLNNFTGEGMQMKLMATTFQNMFPTINITNVNLSTIRRCVLLNYNSTTKLIDFRHYTIKVVPVGVSKGVKKVVQGKIPNLAKCEDIGDYFAKTGNLSESEFEDDGAGQVNLPQQLTSRGNIQDQKSSIRLTELGPRITMQLIKVEDGLMDGEVLFHELISKTEEEKELIQKKRLEKKKLKEKLRKIQEKNMERKENEKLKLKEKSLKGMGVKHETDKLMEKAVNEANENDDQVDDDAEYYKDEVGANPDKELFTPHTRGTKRPFKTPMKYNKNKKMKLDSKSDMNKKTKSKENGEDRFKQASKYKSKGQKKLGGRGNNPKYGWRAQERNEGFDSNKTNVKKSHSKKNKR